MISKKKPPSHGKSKVMLHLQSKEKNILDRGTEKHRQAADRQSQTAALKQGQCLSVRLNSVTLASGSARTIQNRGCGKAVGPRSSDLAVFCWSGEPWNDGHMMFFIKDWLTNNC